MTSKYSRKLFFFLATTFMLPQIVAQQFIADSYTVNYSNIQPQLIHVSARIYLEDAVLRMSKYGPMPEKWTDYISNLEVTDSSGNQLDVKFTEDNEWVISPMPDDNLVDLTYDLQVLHEESNWPGGTDGVAFTRPWGVMTSGRSLFIVNGKDKKDIQLRFELPDHWKVSAPWKQGKKASEFRVTNQLQLQESLIFAGTHEEIVFPKGDFKLKFVLGGTEIQKNKENYILRARQVLDYYIELMGGNPIPGPGNELSTAMVLINESEEIDGEVIGNHLSMFLNPNADMQNKTIGWFMFAHEFFHLWNGKTLRFSNTEADWFKEGVTSYYTLKALYKVGAVNEDISKMIMNNLFYQRYTNDPGFGKMAPSEAASGFDKDNHWGLVYGGGFFGGVCMDLLIRNNNNNELSLDHVMRALYNDFGGSKNSIDNKVLKKYILNISQTDVSPLMNTCITGLEAVPITKYFDFAGIEAIDRDGQLVLSQDPGRNVLEEEIWNGFLGEN